MAIIPVIAIALLILAIVKLCSNQDAYNYNAAYYATLAILRHINHSGQAMSLNLLNEYKAALKFNNVSMMVGHTDYDKTTQRLTIKGVEL